MNWPFQGATGKREQVLGLAMAQPGLGNFSESRPVMYLNLAILSHVASFLLYLSRSDLILSAVSLRCGLTQPLQDSVSSFNHVLPSVSVRAYKSFLKCF